MAILVFALVLAGAAPAQAVPAPDVPVSEPQVPEPQVPEPQVPGPAPQSPDSQPQVPDPALAEQHEARAMALWEMHERQLELTEKELLQAYSRNPLPKYLFALGTVARDRRQCGRAVRYFQRFLDALPTVQFDDESRRAQVEADAKQAIASCGGRSMPAVAKPTVPDSPPSPSPRPAPAWHRDAAGAALLAVGAAGVAAGAGLLIAGSVADRRLPDAPSISDFAEDRRRARALGVAGVATTAVGGAFVVAAVIRYAVVRARQSRAAARLHAGPRGAYVGLRVAF